MKQWIISYQDKDGELHQLDFAAEQRPSREAAARHLRWVLFPNTHDLDLNDLDGRAKEATVKSLKDQNAVELLSITEAP